MSVAKARNDDCDLAMIVKDHVDVFMEVVQRYFPNWSMADRTKCVNTAAMMMMLYIGLSARDHVDVCSVENVKWRREQQRDLGGLVDAEVARLFQNYILGPCVRAHRELFYVMVTNGTWVHPDGRQVVFPGHVFVIEKLSGSQLPYYRLYQSYISRFTLQEVVDNGAMYVDYSVMSWYASRFVRLMETKTWDDDINRFWNAFAKLSTPDDINGPYVGLVGWALRDVHMCFRHVKIPAKMCLENVDRLLRDFRNQPQQQAQFAQWFSGNARNARELESVHDLVVKKIRRGRA